MTFTRTFENLRNEQKTVELTTVSGHVFTGKIIQVEGIKEESMVIINDPKGVAVVAIPHIVSIQTVHTPTIVKRTVGRPAKV